MSTGVPPRTDPAASDSSHRARVLVVDDSILNRRVAEDVLALADYEVDTVADGVEAVEAVQRSDFDIVLMDLDLPNMDGYEAARTIRQMGGSKQSVSILALSAHTMRKDVDQCLDNGMNGHIAKPYSVSRLLAAVAECLASRRQQAA